MSSNAALQRGTAGPAAAAGSFLWWQCCIPCIRAAANCAVAYSALDHIRIALHILLLLPLLLLLLLLSS
jgi:hypothetical protein